MKYRKIIVEKWNYFSKYDIHICIEFNGGWCFMASSSKREQLIETALELFSRQGFHAVGIDAILEKSGVAKKTLYNHFKSKGELILAVLRYYDERFRNQFMRSVESRSDSPIGRLLAIFDVAEELIGRKDFNGCLFVGAAGEYPEEGTPIRNTCKESKNLMLDYLSQLAVQAGARQPKDLAQQLMILLEGALSLAKIHKSPLSAVQAKKAGKVLINDSIPGSF